MADSLNTLLHYTKLLTALVIILNVALILCLRSHIIWVKKFVGVESEEGKKFFKGKVIFGLVILVMAINGMAVVANGQMLKAIRGVSASMVGKP